MLELFLDPHHSVVLRSVTLPGLIKTSPVKIIKAAITSPKCLWGFSSYIIPHILVTDHISDHITYISYPTWHHIRTVSYSRLQGVSSAVQLQSSNDAWAWLLHRAAEEQMINGLLASLRQWPFVLINIYRAINFLDCIWINDEPWQICMRHYYMHSKPFAHPALVRQMILNHLLSMVTFFVLLSSHLCKKSILSAMLSEKNLVSIFSSPQDFPLQSIQNLCSFCFSFFSSHIASCTPLQPSDWCGWDGVQRLWGSC